MKSYLVDFENVKSKGLAGIEKLCEDDRVIIFYSDNSDTISFEMHCMVMRSKADVQYIKVKVGGKNALDFQLSTLLGYLVAKELYTHIFVISNDKGFDKLHDFWENTFEDAPSCKVYRTQNISAAINYAKYNLPPIEEPTEEEQIADEVKDIEITQTAAEPISAEIKVTDTPADNIAEEGVIVVPETLIDSFREEQEHSAEDKETDLTAKVMELIPEIDENSAHTIADCMENSQSKLELHNALAKLFDVDTTGKYYNAVKAEYVELHKNDTAKTSEQNAADDEEQQQGQPKKVDIAMKKRLHSILDGIATPDEFSGIVAQINQSMTIQQLYINMIQRFKKDRGRELYNAIKDEYREYIKEDEVKPKRKRKAKTDKATDAKADTAAALPEQPDGGQQSVLERLKASVGDKMTDDEINEVYKIMANSSSSHDLYLGVIKQFRKSRGLTVYNYVKGEFRQMVASAKGEGS